MDFLNPVKPLALLPMTLDTYGLPEDKYLAIFKEKAEFACKALRIVEHVASDYNIKLDPKLFWDLYQEIGYATDDACRVKQKKEDPQALEERSYTSTTYPTTGAVFTEVQKLEKLMNTFILNQAMPDDQYDEEKKHQESRVDSNGKILRKRKTPWYINSLALSEDDDKIKE
jgi:hypothetical protein